MSDRKDIKKPLKAPLSSIAKTQVGSSQKKTAVKSRLHEDVRSHKKNLIPEFEKASKQEVGKKLFVEVEVEEEASGSVSVDSMISSHVTSEVGERAAMSEIGENAVFGSSGFDFQLPRSYIIAMSGLQEAVGQREGEMRKMRGDLEKRKEVIVTLSGELDHYKAREQENYGKVLEYASQIKGLKSASSDLQKQFVQSEQIRLALERQLESQQLALNEVKKKAEKVEVENSIFREQIELSAKEFKNMEKENMVRNIKEVQEIQDQVKREKEGRKRAEKQVEILREQTSILAEKNVMGDQGNEVLQRHEQLLLNQKANLMAMEERLVRQPLLEVIAANSLRRQYSAKKVSAPVDFSRPEARHQTAQKLSNHSEIVRSGSKAQVHAKKMTQCGLMSRERSMTRVASKQTPPELVSQFRELMRHEKELIGLNYHLQTLEKEMANEGRGEGRAQLQRSYQKLRRQSEQKEMQVRELKTFLNDPLK